MFSLWQRIDSYHYLKEGDQVIVSNFRDAISIGCKVTKLTENSITLGRFLWEVALRESIGLFLLHHSSMERYS